ncbi:patatin-like phospholipase family protein [Chloroflexia bacterium SDU3-3]|nr:patatin-like phospholipase family protein [Chloroflexia bacterium SDU3-3]
MATPKKALVLSGGGARGAYHIGVLEALVEHGWIEDGRGPDIIAGTSIGAINAAALASGLTVAQLKQHWLAMHTEDVHQLSADLPPVVKPLLRFLLRSVLTSEAHGGPLSVITSEERQASLHNLFSNLGTLFAQRPFLSLLDTAPWRRTLAGWMDFGRINSPQSPALLLAATELQTGALELFCNRELNGAPATTIGIEHLMASSSIPIVYPWTQIGAGRYWDGAVLANTPLEPVIDLAGDDEVDILVVMMTPWNADPSVAKASFHQTPQDLIQALTLALDWTLLASYRVAFEALERRNREAELIERLRLAAVRLGDASLVPAEYPRRIRPPLVVAPKDLMPMEWIIDYEDSQHHQLFAMGRADAERALAAAQ